MQKKTPNERQKAIRANPPASLFQSAVLPLFTMLFCFLAAPVLAQTKPNIVFILMDNLGYGEVGCYGGGAPTPRIDKLATEGTRLTNSNVEAQCTPSRSAIMTGRFAIRSGTHSVPLPGTPDGLTQWEVTIAELLSGAGYGWVAIPMSKMMGEFELGLKKAPPIAPGTLDPFSPSTVKTK